MIPMAAGPFKQELLRIYNEINKKIFSVGVKQQKVELIGNKIVIISVNPRVPALKLLDKLDRATTRNLDFSLADYFKKEIKDAFEAAFPIHIVAILKDYDVMTDYSGTIVILDRDLRHDLNDPSEL